METVKVVEIRSTRKSGPLRAFADVRIGNMTVTDFRVFQENGEKARVEVPVTTWRLSQTHELRFKPIITLPGDLMGRVQAEILSNYYREMEKQNGTQNSKSDPK